MGSILSSRWIKVVVFAAALLPLGVLVVRGLQGNLSANPVEYITHATGDWTLRFLLLTLAITPGRKILHLPPLIRLRRMLGLFAFFYASLHFLIYAALEHLFNPLDIGQDMVKHPFVLAGFTAFVLLIPLAITSTTGWIRRLGGRNWQRLHRAIYISVVCGVVHYTWLVKSDLRAPLAYGAIVLILLGWRLVQRLRSAA